MSELLFECPVKVFEIGATNSDRGLSLLRLNPHLQINVQCVGISVTEVRQRFRLLETDTSTGVSGRTDLLGIVRHEWSQCIHCNHPWRDGCPHAFAQEWSQWDVLPFLNVSRCKDQDYLRKRKGFAHRAIHKRNSHRLDRVLSTMDRGAS